MATWFGVVALKVLVRRWRRPPMIVREPPAGMYVHPRVIELLRHGYVNQRSRWWFKHRSERLTASDVDAALGRGRFGNYKSVLKKKTKPSPKRNGSGGSWHTQHGIFYEDHAIRRFEEQYKRHVFEFGLLPHPTESWLGASPDGICATGEMVEVKCPSTRPILEADDYPLGCPDYYYGQVQCQLECADLEKCYFVQFKPANVWEEEKLLVTEVYRDREWWARAQKTLWQLWQDVVAFREAHPDWYKVDHYAEPKSNELEDFSDSVDTRPPTKRARIEPLLTYEQMCAPPESPKREFLTLAECRRRCSTEPSSE